MSLSALLPKYLFGLREDVRDNLQFIDDASIIYPAGNNVVVHNLENRTQRFLSCSVEAEGVTAVAVSSNRKFVAVAEKAERATISVYDLQTFKRKKVLITAEAGSKEYVSLSFSPDAKLIAAQSGTPEWNLLLWSWEKSKLLSSTKSGTSYGAQMTQVLYHPADGSELISVVGDGVFRMYRAAENSLKGAATAFAKADKSDYSCHAWMQEGERVVVGTKSGGLLFADTGMENPIPLATESERSVCALAPFSKGFVAGFSGGLVQVFEKEPGGDDEMPFRRTTSFSIPEVEAQNIMGLAISPNEEQMIVTLDNNEIFAFTMGDTAEGTPQGPDNNFVHKMACSLHTGEVLGVDGCVRKPLLASCGMDRSVRVWNLADKTIELMVTFPVEAFSISLHPSGLHVLVGFADKLRFMNLLNSDFKTTWEFNIRGCRECCFSHGGHLFAAVNGQNILLYNSYTAENVGNLRGHSGKIKKLLWSPDDSHLLSVGSDGAVYDWKVRNLRRDREYVTKGVTYNSIAIADDGKLFVAGSDHKIKELDDEQGSGTQVCREVDTGSVTIMQICLPAGGRTLFAGTDTGCIRSYKLPVSQEFHEYKCCNAPISRMCLSFDDNQMFVAAEDGTIMIFDVKDKDLSKIGRSESYQYSEEVLVNKGDLEEKYQHMAELETQVRELSHQNEYALRLKELEHNEKLKDVVDKYSSELVVERGKFENLLKEKNQQELEYEEKMKSAEEQHQAAVAALDNQYQVKMLAEIERYQQAMKEKDALNDRWEEQTTQLVESHQAVMLEIKTEYETKLEEEVKRFRELKAAYEQIKAEAEELRIEMEVDADEEIEDLKQKYEVKLASEREAGLRMKGENGIMKKKFTALQQDIDEQRDEIKTLFEHKKELYQTINNLEREIVTLKQEIGERDETIVEKEERIYELKRKNQELEKFKFVLDYKNKDLKKQLEPKNSEIADLQAKIKALKEEVERQQLRLKVCDNEVTELNSKNKALRQELGDERKLKGELAYKIREFEHDLQLSLQHLQNPKLLKEQIKQLCSKHGVAEPTGLQGSFKQMSSFTSMPSMTAHSAQPPESAADFEAERRHYEETIKELRVAVSTAEKYCRKESIKLMRENMALMTELRQWRAANKGPVGTKSRMSGRVTAVTDTENAQPVSPRPLTTKSSPGRRATPAVSAKQGEAQESVDSALIHKLQETVVVQQQMISGLEERLAVTVAELEQMHSARVASPRPAPHVQHIDAAVVTDPYPDAEHTQTSETLIVNDNPSTPSPSFDFLGPSGTLLPNVVPLNTPASALDDATANPPAPTETPHPGSQPLGHLIPDTLGGYRSSDYFPRSALMPPAGTPATDDSASTATYDPNPATPFVEIAVQPDATGRFAEAAVRSQYVSSYITAMQAAEGSPAQLPGFPERRPESLGSYTSPRVSARYSGTDTAVGEVLNGLVREAQMSSPGSGSIRSMSPVTVAAQSVMETLIHTPGVTDVGEYSTRGNSPGSWVDPGVPSTPGLRITDVSSQTEAGMNLPLSGTTPEALDVKIVVTTQHEVEDASGSIVVRNEHHLATKVGTAGPEVNQRLDVASLPLYPDAPVARAQSAGTLPPSYDGAQAVQDTSGAADSSESSLGASGAHSESLMTPPESSDASLGAGSLAGGQLQAGIELAASVQPDLGIGSVYDKVDATLVVPHGSGASDTGAGLPVGVPEYLPETKHSAGAVPGEDYPGQPEKWRIPAATLAITSDGAPEPQVQSMAAHQSVDVDQPSVPAVEGSVRPLPSKQWRHSASTLTIPSNDTPEQLEGMVDSNVMATDNADAGHSSRPASGFTSPSHSFDADATTGAESKSRPISARTSSVGKMAMELGSRPVSARTSRSHAYSAGKMATELGSRPGSGVTSHSQASGLMTPVSEAAGQVLESLMLMQATGQNQEQ